METSNINTKEYWNINYRENGFYQDHSAVDWELTHNFIKTVLPVKPCRILELACGLGHNAKVAASLGHFVVATDFSQIAIEANKERFTDKNIRYECLSLEEAIAILKNELNNISTKGSWIYIPEIDKEVEIEVHDKNKSFDDLKKIYGANFENMLLTKEECELILKNKEISKILKMDGSSTDDDFFIQQFNEENKKKGYVADFCVIGYWSSFYSFGYSGGAYDYRGVRTCRKKIKGEK